MLDQIVKAAAKKAKIPDAVAMIVVTTAIAQLKKKLPPAVGNILDSVLAGGDSKGAGKFDASALGELGDLASKFLGGGSKSSSKKK